MYAGLGSNLGDRAENLRNAIRAIIQLADTSVLRLSSLYETEPVGLRGQPDFLNLVAEIETGLRHDAFLRAIKSIERGLGREPDAPRWGPRVIDIDVLLWGDEIVETAALRIPHPEFRNRAFVLAPLRELNPDLVDPLTKKSVAQLHDDCRDPAWVRRLGPLDDV